MTTNEPAPGCISCCKCCREIPLDAALTAEGAEYVEYFCGLECYQQFLMLAAERERNISARPEAASRSTGTVSNAKLKSGK